MSGITDVKELFHRKCVRTLIRHDANVPEGGIWGDKSPSHLHHIESIRAIYPSTKFIHLIRDARDYVLFGKGFERKAAAAQRWNDAILLAKAEGERLGTTLSKCGMKTWWMRRSEAHRCAHF